MPITGPTTDHHEIRMWAESHGAVPAEVLPSTVDHIPAILRFVLATQLKDEEQLRKLSWDEFFLKFDSLGLAFVYDNDHTGFNELLQVEARSPYRNQAYRSGVLTH